MAYSGTPFGWKSVKVTLTGVGGGKVGVKMGSLLVSDQCGAELRIWRRASKLAFDEIGEATARKMSCAMGCTCPMIGTMQREMGSGWL